METFIKEYCKKNKIKAVNIGGSLYMLNKDYVGADFGMLIPTHCKKKDVEKDRFFCRPFSKDETGDWFYLLNIKDEIDILNKKGERETIKIVDFFSEFFSQELNEYLSKKLWGDWGIPKREIDIDKTILAKIAINFIHRYNCDWKKIWKKIWRIKNAPFGVDRQIEAIDECLKEFVCSRRCGGGISARDWEVRIFPVFRAVLREMQKTTPYGVVKLKYRR